MFNWSRNSTPLTRTETSLTGSGTLLQSLFNAEPITRLASNPQTITELRFNLHNEVRGNRMRVNEVQTISIVFTFC